MACVNLIAKQINHIEALNKIYQMGEKIEEMDKKLNNILEHLKVNPNE